MNNNTHKTEYFIDEILKQFRERKIAFEKLAEALTRMRYEKHPRTGIPDKNPGSNKAHIK